MFSRNPEPPKGGNDDVSQFAVEVMNGADSDDDDSDFDFVEFSKLDQLVTASDTDEDLLRKMQNITGIPPEASVKSVSREHTNDAISGAPPPPLSKRSEPPTVSANPIASQETENAQNPIIGIGQLYTLQQDYKATALQLLKYVDQFDMVVKEVENGQKVNLNDIPPPPNQLLEFMSKLQTSGVLPVAGFGTVLVQVAAGELKQSLEPPSVDVTPATTTYTQPKRPSPQNQEFARCVTDRTQNLTKLYLSFPYVNSESFKGGNFLRFFHRSSDALNCARTYVGPYNGHLPGFKIPLHQCDTNRIHAIVNAILVAFIQVWPNAQGWLLANCTNTMSFRPFAKIVKWTIRSFIGCGEEFVIKRLKLLCAWAKYKAEPHLYRRPPAKILWFPLCDARGVPDFSRIFVGSIAEKAGSARNLLRLSEMDL